MTTHLRHALSILSAILLFLCGTVSPSGAGELRIGLIGLDSSHAVAFTKLINATDGAEIFEGVNVVAAFPGGSPDIAASTDRIEKFTQDVTNLGVKIVPSIDELLPLVDAIIINSVDGRTHLRQARPVIEKGLPLFIDKPVAANVAETVEIFNLAKEKGVACFSSSTLRFCDEVIAIEKESPVGKIVGCEAYSPSALEKTHQDLYWYGIHGVETLFAIMGPGCQSVSRSYTDGTDVVTGIWADGRIGTFRGIRDGRKAYGVLLYGENDIQHVPIRPRYNILVEEIVRCFKTGQVPVSAEETIEIAAFMQAAQVSREKGGAPVTLESVMPERGN